MCVFFLFFFAWLKLEKFSDRLFPFSTFLDAAIEYIFSDRVYIYVYIYMYIYMQPLSIYSVIDLSSLMHLFCEV